MGKNHLKRLAVPNTWKIMKREFKFITKPNPGPHPLSKCISLNTLIKEILKYATTTREVKKILMSGQIKIDGIVRKEPKFPVGIFDTIEFSSLEEYFRVILDRLGNLSLVKINEKEVLIKPCKIVKKSMVKGKLQLNLYDGKNLFVDKGSYKVGDSVILKLPEQKIEKHLAINKKSTIFLVGGNHVGEIGSVEDIGVDKIIYKDDNNNLVETSKEYAFVIEK